MLASTASLAGFAAVAYALCNSLFVSIWTKGQISWPPVNDILLGVWMLVMVMLRCHNLLAVLTKRVGFMRYVYFLEGVVFVAGALLTARRGGLPAVIACSIVSSTAATVMSGAANS